jgi:RNA polymerase sigma-70 factor (ECF subfamily)
VDRGARHVQPTGTNPPRGATSAHSFPNVRRGLSVLEVERQEEDARLVQRARGGDAGAFERLVRRHLRAAHAVALAIVGEPADAEDVCQDSLVAALERLDECRQPERFAAWLLQIVRNRARDALRRRSVRAALPLEAAAAIAGPADPLRDAERSQLRERLLDGLRGRTEVQREIVLLHDLEGWRHAEIAAVLGLSEGTVRNYLFHARRAMRTRLEARVRQES